MVAVYLGQMTRDEMLAKMKNMPLDDDFGPAACRSISVSI